MAVARSPPTTRMRTGAIALGSDGRTHPTRPGEHGDGDASSGHPESPSFGAQARASFLAASTNLFARLTPRKDLLPPPTPRCEEREEDEGRAANESELDARTSILDVQVGALSATVDQAHLRLDHLSEELSRMSGELGRLGPIERGLEKLASQLGLVAAQLARPDAGPTPLAAPPLPAGVSPSTDTQLMEQALHGVANVGVVPAWALGKESKKALTAVIQASLHLQPPLVTYVGYTMTIKVGKRAEFPCQLTAELIRRLAGLQYGTDHGVRLINLFPAPPGTSDVLTACRELDEGGLLTVTAEQHVQQRAPPAGKLPAQPIADSWDLLRRLENLAYVTTVLYPETAAQPTVPSIYRAACTAHELVEHLTLRCGPRGGAWASSIAGAIDQGLEAFTQAMRNLASRPGALRDPSGLAEQLAEPFFSSFKGVFDSLELASAQQHPLWSKGLSAGVSDHQRYLALAEATATVDGKLFCLNYLKNKASCKGKCGRSHDAPTQEQLHRMLTQALAHAAKPADSKALEPSA